MLVCLVADFDDCPCTLLTVLQIDPMLKLREQINGSAAAGTKISVNDFVIKAASLALKKVRGGGGGGNIRGAWRSGVDGGPGVDGGSLPCGRGTRRRLWR